MAFAVQPLMTLGTTALSKMPDAIRAVQKKAPGVYSKLAKAVSSSNTTPERLATVATRSPAIAQGLVETALKSGAKARDFIEAGVFHPEAEGQINALAQAYVSNLAQMAEVNTVKPATTAVEIAAEIRLTDRVGSILSVDKADLALLLMYFRTHGPEDVEAVINFRKAAGIKAY